MTWRWRWVETQNECHVFCSAPYFICCGSRIWEFWQWWDLSLSFSLTMRLMKVLLTHIAFAILLKDLLGFLRTSSRARSTIWLEVAVAGIPLSGRSSDEQILVSFDGIGDGFPTHRKRSEDVAHRWCVLWWWAPSADEKVPFCRESILQLDI